MTNTLSIGAATERFELPGGGGRDAQWDRSGMGQNRFAALEAAAAAERRA